jgi:LytS/YehU family sensor histidine kinase
MEQLKQLEREKEMEELRRLTSESQMQTLRLQMNPHFLYNVLTEIQRLVESTNPRAASHYIGIFSKLLRRIVHQAGKEYIAVSDEMSILRQYMDLEELRNAGRLKCYITLGVDALETQNGDSAHDDPEAKYWQQREIPMFILQPFVENAIRHGIRGLEEEDWKTRQIGTISLSILEEQGTLRCVIEDNGVGRAAAARRKGEHTKQENLSIATTITAKRLKLLKSTFGQEFPVIYNDLYDEDSKGAGTQVTVVLPWRLKQQETHN